MGFLRLSVNKIRISANRSCFVSSLAVEYLLFLFLVKLSWLEPPVLMLNTNDKSGFCSLGSDSREKAFTLSPLCIFLAVGFVCRCPLSSCRSFFYFLFVACSYNERVLDFVIYFFWVNKMTCDFCLLLY